MERVYVLFDHFDLGSRGEELGTAAAGYTYRLVSSLGAEGVPLSSFRFPTSLSFLSFPSPCIWELRGTSTPGLTCHFTCRAGLTGSGAMQAAQRGTGTGRRLGRY